jgi:hypothetical protein
MTIVRWIVSWFARGLWAWANPEEAKKVAKLLADVKTQGASAEQTKVVITGEETKVGDSTKAEDDAAQRQTSQEAAADQTDKELNEALKPKTTPPRADDDELHHLSERV